MAMTSPAVKQAKFLRAFSRTAFGLVMSKKSTDWGWNFEYVATGRDVDSTRIMWPSSNKRFLIILVKNTIVTNRPMTRHRLPVWQVHLPFISHKFKDTRVSDSILGNVGQLEEHRIRNVESCQVVQSWRRHDDLPSFLHVCSLIPRQHADWVAAVHGGEWPGIVLVEHIESEHGAKCDKSSQQGWWSTKSADPDLTSTQSKYQNTFCYFPLFVTLFAPFYSTMSPLLPATPTNNSDGSSVFCHGNLGGWIHLHLWMKWPRK